MMKKYIHFAKEQKENQTFAYTDETLCQYACQGNGEAAETLVRRYEVLVKMCVRPYYLLGADNEDLIQEGMIGLLKAIYNFRSERGMQFNVFARLCITRNVYSAIKTAATKKHFPLNYYVSIGKPLFGDSAGDYISQDQDAANPEELIIGKEQVYELKEKFSGVLSTFEAKVLELYLQEKSYEEISKILGKPTKAIDNAIQRIRQKAAQLLF